MGAFGSCLGVGRPVRPDADPRLLASNLVRVDVKPCGPGGLQSARTQMGRRPNSYMTGGPGQTSSSNGHQQQRGGPMPKLMRQTSALTGANGLTAAALLSSPNSTAAQAVSKLVDIDDNVPLQNNSHALVGGANRRQRAVDGGPVDAQRLIDTFLQDLRANPDECRVLLALFDYAPRSEEDLPFQKGEHLETALPYMKGDWWLVQSKSTKRTGYVPKNYVSELKSLGAEPWYFGKIGRQLAESRLQMPENGQGSFIIRISDSERDSYSLTLKHENHVKHYKIQAHETGGYFINKKLVFSTIHDLVLHYSNVADGLCVKLGEPCKSRSELPATIGLSYDTHDKWEIDRNELKLLNELGRGQFGQVYEGLFRDKTRVAIKTLRKGSMDPQDFLAEAQIMKQMQHENLVQLFAVCTRQEPVFIITELMSKGALINYLQTPEGKNLELRMYIEMASQIASGMAYLEKEKYVHRDLAARNILVGDNNVCKIADFGLARFIKETEYEARAGARFPIKWTAPEAANFSKFTIKSDVWSFGIVLYEIITKGGTPYPDMTNAEVLTKIDRGYRMSKPPNCPDKYFRVMIDCWKKDSQQRPTFATLEWRLNDYFVSDEQYRDASQFRER